VARGAKDLHVGLLLVQNPNVAVGIHQYLGDGTEENLIVFVPAPPKFLQLEDIHTSWWFAGVADM
jgi:hypothetical protein